jgi:hypothetical protein
LGLPIVSPVTYAKRRPVSVPIAGEEGNVAAKEVMKELGSTLVWPALWIALLLLVASVKANGGVPATDFDVKPAGALVVDFAMNEVHGNALPVLDCEPTLVSADHD